MIFIIFMIFLILMIFHAISDDTIFRVIMSLFRSCIVRPSSKTSSFGIQLLNILFTFGPIKPCNSATAA